MKKISLFFIAVLSVISVNAQSLSVSLSPYQYPNGYNISVNGGTDGSINVTVANAIGPVTFLWNDSVTMEDRANLAAGTYSVLVTDSLDSTATATVTLTQPAALQPLVVFFEKSNYAGGYNISSFGAANGSITLTVTGGMPPYSYLWNTGAVTKDVSGLSAGTYSVTVTDSLGTTATGSQTLLQPGQPLGVQINSNGGNPCGGASMPMLNAMVSGGTPPYQYQWLREPDFVLAETWSMITATISGTYHVKVKDANLDSAMAVYVVQPSPMMLSAMAGALFYPNNQPFSCDSCDDGRLAVNAYGGTPPYSYLWAGGQTTDTITGLAPSPTPYSVTVTDANGCTAYGSYMLYNMPPPPPPMMLMVYGYTSTFAGTGNVSCDTCSDGSITLSVNGGTMPYSFAWSNGATTQSLTGIDTGFYSVTVTDMMGATSNQSFNIMFYSMPPPPPPMGLMVMGYPSTFPGTGNVSCATCSDGSISLMVNGGMPPYTFDWSNDSITQNISGLDTGYYSVTVTDMVGATTTQGFNITFYSMPPPPPPMGLMVYGYPYMYPGTGNVSCASCFDGSITLSVSGGMPPYSYDWSNDSTTQNISGLDTGYYSVTVMDMMGATATQGFNIMYYSAPPPPSGLTVNVMKSDYAGGYNVSCSSCADGWINLMVSGGMPPYQFWWEDNGMETGANRSNLAAGIYHGRVSSMNGDSAHVYVSLIAPTNQINVQLSANVQGGCNGGPVSGNINAMVMGGTPPYTFQWSGPNGMLPDNWQSISVMQEGTYYVTVTDANNATAQGNVNVFPPSAVNVWAEAVEQYGEAHTGCTVADGTLRIHLQGGQPPYNVNVESGGGKMRDLYSNNNSSQNQATEGFYFSINTSDTLIELDSLGAGWYNVWVNDMSMCGNGSGVELRQAEPPVVTVSGTEYENGYYFSCDTCGDAQMSANVAGGFGAMQYHWFEIPVEHAMMNLKGASLFMSENKDFNVNDLPPAVSTSQTANITNAETLHELLVADELGCVGFTNFTLEKPKPVNAWGFSGNDGAGKWLGTNNETDLILKSNNQEGLRLKSTGNIGIGTSNPQAKLDVNGSAKINGLLNLPLIADQTAALGLTCPVLLGMGVDGNVLGLTPEDECLLSYFNSSQQFWRVNGNFVSWDDDNFIGTTNEMPFRIRTNNQEWVTITTDGRVGINTGNDVNNIPDNYRLAVKGYIIAEDVDVRLFDSWPDYVFNKDYKLPSLFELEKYIDTNKHLPGIPDASTVKEDGIRLGEMSALTMEKVEELTLYMIQMNKENEALKQRVEELEKALQNK